MTNSKDYTIEDINRQIKRQLIRVAIYKRCTHIVEFILEAANYVNNAPFTYADIENRYRRYCNECRTDLLSEDFDLNNEDFDWDSVDGRTLEEIDQHDIVPNKKFRCGCCGEVYKTYSEAFECCSIAEDNEIYKPEEVWLCPFCGDIYPTIEEAQECICHYGTSIFRCPYCGVYYTELDAPIDDELNGISQWWEVSGWFGDELAACGEVVIRGYHTYWGSQKNEWTSPNDSIIHKIANNMKILYGQEHSWENKIN